MTTSSWWATAIWQVGFLGPGGSGRVALHAGDRRRDILRGQMTVLLQHWETRLRIMVTGILSLESREVPRLVRDKLQS